MQIQEKIVDRRLPGVSVKMFIIQLPFLFLIVFASVFKGPTRSRINRFLRSLLDPFVSLIKILRISRAEFLYCFPGECLNARKLYSGYILDANTSTTLFAEKAFKVSLSIYKESLKRSDCTGLVELPLFKRRSYIASGEILNARLIVAPSRYIADQVNDIASESRVIVQHYPCPSEMFPYSEKTSSMFDSSNKFRILYNGRLSCEKFFPMLLEAVRSLRSSKVELIACGEPHLPKEYLACFSDFLVLKGRVARKDVVNLLHSSHVYCHPSIIEGQSLSVTEALLSGTPAIVFKNSIPDDFSPGILTNFSEPTVHALRDAIQYALRNQLNIIKCSRDLRGFSKVLSPEAYVRKLADSIDSALQ